MKPAEAKPTEQGSQGADGGAEELNGGGGSEGALLLLVYPL